MRVNVTVCLLDVHLHHELLFRGMQFEKHMNLPIRPFILSFVDLGGGCSRSPLRMYSGSLSVFTSFYNLSFTPAFHVVVCKFLFYFSR
jgi:hypothetical protein